MVVIENRQAVWLVGKPSEVPPLPPHRMYFQGLQTHSVLPDGGNDVAADRLNIHPTDQAEPWTTFGTPLPGPFPAALTLDVYEGPLGKGFTVTADFTHSGIHWQRTRNRGPESWRETDWREIDPSRIP